MQSEGTSLVPTGSRAFRVCCRAFRLVTAYSNTRDKACEGRVVKQRHNNKQSKAASQAVMKV